MSIQPYCAICFDNVYQKGEYAFMLKNSVWKEAVLAGHEIQPAVDHRSLLCVECIETCLDRELNTSDFPASIPLNQGDQTAVYGRSKLLISRLNAPIPEPVR